MTAWVAQEKPLKHTFRGVYFLGVSMAKAKGDLTPMQRLFVEAYSGNGTAAAIAAGYSQKSAEKIARDLLRNPTVAAAIRGREEKEIKPLVASRMQRQEFWTNTMQNDGEDMRDRLKASELLGKSEGDFLERVEHSGNLNAEIQIIRIPDNGRSESN